MNSSLLPPSPQAPPRRVFTFPSPLGAGRGTSVLVDKLEEHSIIIPIRLVSIISCPSSNLSPDQPAATSHPALLLLSAAIIINDLGCNDGDNSSLLLLPHRLLLAWFAPPILLSEQGRCFWTI